MAIFNSYVSHYQRVNPLVNHVPSKTAILWVYPIFRQTQNVALNLTHVAISELAGTVTLVNKHPAGSGMERVGVSKSLLGTYDQHWDLPVILPLTMMQHV